MVKISSTHHMTKNGKVKKNPSKKKSYVDRIYRIYVADEDDTGAFDLMDTYRGDTKDYDRLFMNKLIADWEQARSAGEIQESTFAGTEVYLKATPKYHRVFKKRYESFMDAYISSKDRPRLILETDDYVPDWAMFEDEDEEEDW